MTRLSSSQTWVMPTFSPTIAFVAIAVPSPDSVTERWSLNWSLNFVLALLAQAGCRRQSFHADAPPAMAMRSIDRLGREVPAGAGHTRTSFGEPMVVRTWRRARLVKL